MTATPRDPRVLYLSLLAAATLGGAAGWAIERFAPSHEFAARHAAAVTPLALAVTSPRAELLMAVATCMMMAWGLTLLVFWVRWRLPGPNLIQGRTDPIVQMMYPATILLFAGLNSLATLSSVADAGWFVLGMHSLFTLMGVLSVCVFALQLFTALHPRLRARYARLYPKRAWTRE